MLKWLLVVVIVVVAFYLWRSARERDSDRPAPVAKPPAKANTSPQEMVRCAHCGVHLPRQDAYLNGPNLYCSTDHLKLGPQSRPDGD